MASQREGAWPAREKEREEEAHLLVEDLGVGHSLGDEVLQDDLHVGLGARQECGWYAAARPAAGRGAGQGGPLDCARTLARSYFSSRSSMSTFPSLLKSCPVTLANFLMKAAMASLEGANRVPLKAASSSARPLACGAAGCTVSCPAGAQAAEGARWRWPGRAHVRTWTSFSSSERAGFFFTAASRSVKGAAEPEPASGFAEMRMGVAVWASAPATRAARATRTSSDLAILRQRKVR